MLTLHILLYTYTYLYMYRYANVCSSSSFVMMMMMMMRKGMEWTRMKIIMIIFSVQKEISMKYWLHPTSIAIDVH